jgi:predicted nucleic acid-binding protein
MIFLDTNVFLRHLTEAPDEHTQRLQDTAEALFLAAEEGDIEVTTSEVVLHETLYFLTQSTFYNFPVEKAVISVRSLLQLKGFRLSPAERIVFFRALDLYEDRPSLGFADSVIAARCEANGWELATFDEQLGSLPSVTRWAPSATA